MRAAFTDPPIVALMVGQTLISAAFYYVFPALVLEWRAEFGWSTGQIMGAFSLALGIQGLVAQKTGSLIDRGLALWSMTLGALLGAACLALLTRVDTLWQLYALWCVLGLAMGLTLYEAVFALVIRGRPETARDCITAITLVAGFASTIAYLLTAWVSQDFGWRTAVWVLIGLVLTLSVPLNAVAAQKLESRETAAAPSKSGKPAAIASRPGYWPLTIGISLSALAIGIVMSHMLPLLAALGLASATAVLAASLVGPSQVAGRVVMTLAGRGIAGRSLAVAALAGMALAALILLGVQYAPLLVFVFAVVHGICYGLTSILRPLVIRETFGSQNFGALQGSVLRPAFFAFALSPFVAALIADLGGYLPVIVLCIAAQAVGALMLWHLPKTAN